MRGYKGEMIGLQIFEIMLSLAVTILMIKLLNKLYMFICVDDHNKNIQKNVTNTRTKKLSIIVMIFYCFTLYSLIIHHFLMKFKGFEWSIIIGDVCWISAQLFCYILWISRLQSTFRNSMYEISNKLYWKLIILSIAFFSLYLISSLYLCLVHELFVSNKYNYTKHQIVIYIYGILSVILIIFDLIISVSIINLFLKRLYNVMLTGKHSWIKSNSMLNYDLEMVNEKRQKIIDEHKELKKKQKKNQRNLENLVKNYKYSADMDRNDSDMFSDSGWNNYPSNGNIDTSVNLELMSWESNKNTYVSPSLNASDATEIMRQMQSDGNGISQTNLTLKTIGKKSTDVDIQESEMIDSRISNHIIKQSTLQSTDVQHKKVSSEMPSIKSDQLLTHLKSQTLMDKYLDDLDFDERETMLVNVMTKYTLLTVIAILITQLYLLMSIIITLYSLSQYTDPVYLEYKSIMGNNQKYVWIYYVYYYIWSIQSFIGALCIYMHFKFGDTMYYIICKYPDKKVNNIGIKYSKDHIIKKKVSFRKKTLKDALLDDYHE